jgi:ribose 5-phosphate isomerase B
MSILVKDMPVGLCCDHAGFEYKEMIKGYLESRDIEYIDFGTHSTDSCDYADFAHPCADAVESGKCCCGIAICGSGNGIGMTLNKHQGIRAALCWQPELATLAREHNNANVLVMPARFIAPEVAMSVVDAFFAADFEGGRHERRIEKMPLSAWEASKK